MLDTLRDLLLDYSHAGESDRRIAIEEEIWTQFGTERTVLVWDMAGFSLLTRRHGIVHYLSMVRRMQETTRSIVHEHRGSIVKFEADNGFAVFPDPRSGIDAAIAMNAAFDRENSLHPESCAIRVSCGLDHGRILLMEGQDFFGDAVNIACKLGEDLAGPGEILVTRGAIDLLPDEVHFPGNPIRFSVSGLDLEAVAVERPH